MLAVPSLDIKSSVGWIRNGIKFSPSTWSLCNTKEKRIYENFNLTKSLLVVDDNKKLEKCLLLLCEHSEREKFFNIYFKNFEKEAQR